jgi:hypothetical protein
LTFQTGSKAVGLWFVAHRHRRLQGVVDANKDGVDDRMEKSLTGVAEINN